MSLHIHVHDASPEGERVIAQLERTAQSLANAVGRGARPGNYRAQSLMDKYDDLRSEAIHLGVWDEFCRRKGYSTQSTGMDFFA